MSDFGASFGSSFDPGAGSQSGTGGFDPSAGGGGGGGFDDPGAGDMGMGGWSPFSGGGGQGGGFGNVTAPQNVIGTAFDPTAQSAQQGQQAQQDTQKPQGPSRMDQLQDAIKNLVGGPQHMLTPTLQSLAQTAKHGMGWLNPGDTTGLTSPQLPGPQNDPGSMTASGPQGGPPNLGADAKQVAGDLGFGPGAQSPGQPTGDITGAIPTLDALIKQMFGGAGASTGNQATQPIQYQDPSQVQAATDPAIPEGQVPLPTPRPAAAPGGQIPEGQVPLPTPRPAAADDPAQVSPQSPPVSGGNDGTQPAPGDQTTGSQSSTAAAGTGGQYGSRPQWQNNPTFALIDLLRGDFGSFMKDLGMQMGLQPGQNQANAQRPDSYGPNPGSPQTQTPMQSVPRARNLPAGPGLQSITPDKDPLTTKTIPGAPLGAPNTEVASAAPPSGTPSAGATPQGASAATTGSSAQHGATGSWDDTPSSTGSSGAWNTANASTSPTAPVPQASAAQRAALGLPTAPASNAVPTTRETGTPSGPQAGGADQQANLSYIGSDGGFSRVGGNVTKDISHMDPQFAQRMAAAGKAYEQETGQKPTFGVGYRDVASQRAAYEQNMRKPGGLAAHPAARPGNSLHQSGRAMDLPSGPFRDWMAKNGQRFGLGNPIHNDPNHFQMQDRARNMYAYNPPGGAAPAAGGDMRGRVSNTLRQGGMSSNAAQGVMMNIGEESGWNLASTGSSGEHGLVQFSPTGDEARAYQGYLQQTGQRNGPEAQMQFLTQRLQTAYPQTWARMNAATSPREAAAIFAKEYERPAAPYLARRLARFGNLSYMGQ